MIAVQDRQSVAIIGGSVAGIRCASALARGGFEGSITIYERDAELPHDKPQLSKEFLAGRAPLRLLDLPDRADYRLATVTAVTSGRQVVTQAGSAETFDQVVVATGCNPTFPRSIQEGNRVAAIRSASDSRRLRGLLRPGQRLVVIGGGFLGLEAAATARRLGVDVVVLEANSSLFGRGLRSELAMMVRERHERDGVHIRTGERVIAVNESPSHVTIELIEGTIEADAVLVAVGARPDVAYLQLDAADLANGVACDENLRTAASGIYAIGDCANFINPMYGTRMRLEHWTSAGEQATHVARQILTGNQSSDGCRVLPYAWSDQYDLHIQSIGLVSDLGPVFTSDSSAFAVSIDEAGQVVGLSVINDPRCALAGRRALMAGTRDIDELLDSVLKNHPARTGFTTS